MPSRTKILNVLREKGIKISRQRAWIIAALCRHPVVPDVEQFWLKLRSSKRVSWATTHSTIRILADIGVLEKFTHSRRNAGYKLHPNFLPALKEM